MCDNCTCNPYKPYPVRIEEIITETVDHTLKTFKLVFVNPEDEEKFKYIPGQFAEISIPGQGEIPIGIATSPTEKGFLYFTIQKMGKVSGYIHQMKPGDIIGVRGPLGNWYPWDKMEGKNCVIIGGGCAFSTLRSSVEYMLHPDNRSKFKDIHVVYGARSLQHLLYQDKIIPWRERDDINMHITVDTIADDTEKPTWGCNVGFVPTIVEEKIKDPTDALCIICGPPAMLKFTMPVLDRVGFKHDQIFLSLENRMKCGIGMCGRCNVGHQFVCKDGPVFSLEELGELPSET